MATVTTKAEQVNAARVARRVGGYSELIRLAGELQRRGDGAQLVREADGRFTVRNATAGEPGPRRPE